MIPPIPRELFLRIPNRTTEVVRPGSSLSSVRNKLSASIPYRSMYERDIYHWVIDRYNDRDPVWLFKSPLDAVLETREIRDQISSQFGRVCGSSEWYKVDGCVIGSVLTENIAVCPIYEEIALLFDCTIKYSEARDEPVFEFDLSRFIHPAIDGLLHKGNFLYAGDISAALSLETIGICGSPWPVNIHRVVKDVSDPKLKL